MQVDGRSGGLQEESTCAEKKDIFILIANFNACVPLLGLIFGLILASP
jgi:hypothetical protein